jgi:hypothetical protein
MHGGDMEKFQGNSIRESQTIVPHKLLRKNPDPEYYNKEVKQLKLKVRKEYNRIK